MSKLLTIVFSEIHVLLSFSTKSAELLIYEIWEYSKGLKAVQSHFPKLEVGALAHATIGPICFDPQIK